MSDYHELQDGDFVLFRLNIDCPGSVHVKPDDDMFEDEDPEIVEQILAHNNQFAIVSLDVDGCFIDATFGDRFEIFGWSVGHFRRVK